MAHGAGSPGRAAPCSSSDFSSQPQLSPQGLTQLERALKYRIEVLWFPPTPTEGCAAAGFVMFCFVLVRIPLISGLQWCTEADASCWLLQRRHASLLPAPSSPRARRLSFLPADCFFGQQLASESVFFLLWF